jgi:hypothetical protein
VAVTIKPSLRALPVHTTPRATPPLEPSPGKPRASRLLRRARAPLGVLAGALLLWLLAGVGFLNYDTLYGLVWGQQLARGEAPQYGIPLAPTPHPLVELLGVSFAPLGAGATAGMTMALAFIALSGCGWVLYRLGREWFGGAVGVLAAAILLTRVPIVSYGVRAYVDIPYMLFVLLALLVETRRRHAGAPVFALLALGGLLRPEAWAFSAAYWLYLVVGSQRARSRHGSVLPARGGHRKSDDPRTPGQLAGLALLAASAPAVWLLSDLLATGNPLWSLANTTHTAHELNRITGIGNIPEYIPRRIGEILRPAALAGAALGGVLSLLWLGPPARLGAAAGVLAVGVFAITAAFGLPIDTRYAFLAAAILSVFCGAGAFGWMALPRGDPRRRAWMATGGLVLIALIASLPSQLQSARRELSKLARQQDIQHDLLAFAGDGAISLRCGPVGAPNHASIPLLALYLGAAPSRIVDAQVQQIEQGSYIDPASLQVEHEYVLNLRDRNQPASIPPGFTEASANRSWLLFKRCT